MTRVLEGYPVQEVAAFLGVTERSVHRWLEACRQSGDLDALKAKPGPGRPRNLTRRQERTVLGWLTKSPTGFGFAGELWTSRRLAALIERRWGIRFNANYLVEWLTARRHSAQKPEPRAKERDEVAVARWLAQDWPRIQKKPKPRAPPSCSSTKAASF